MLNLFKGVKGSDVGLIFDIGSASVGAALVRFSKDGKPIILTAVREHMSFFGGIDHTRLFSLMTVALEESVKKISAEFHKRQTPGHRLHVKHIGVVLASPWYTATTLSIHDERATPFTVQESAVQAKIRDIETSFEKSLSDSSLAREFKDKLTVIEQRIIKTEVNGYETRHPYGKKFTQLDMYIYVSVTPLSIKQRIEEILHKSFAKPTPTFYSFALIAFTTLRDLFPEHEDFLFVDVNGEETELTIVKKGVAVKNMSVPVGKSLLVRHMAKFFPDIPSHVAISELTHRKTDSPYESAKEAARKEWSEGFQSIIRHCSEEMFLPPTMFLMADDDVVDLFTAFVQAGNFSQFTLMSDPFIIIPVTADRTQVFCDFDETSCKDPFVAIESVFINTVHNH